MFGELFLYFPILVAAICFGPKILKCRYETEEENIPDMENFFSALSNSAPIKQNLYCYPKVKQIFSDFDINQMMSGNYSIEKIIYLLCCTILRFVAILFIWLMSIYPLGIMTFFLVKNYKKNLDDPLWDTRWYNVIVSHLWKYRKYAFFPILKYYVGLFPVLSILMVFGLYILKFSRTFNYFNGSWNSKPDKWSPIPWFFLAGYYDKSDYDIIPLPSCKTTFGLLRFSCLKEDLFESSYQYPYEILHLMSEAHINTTTVMISILIYYIISTIFLQICRQVISFCGKRYLNSSFKIEQSELTNGRLMCNSENETSDEN